MTCVDNLRKNDNSNFVTHCNSLNFDRQFFAHHHIRKATDKPVAFKSNPAEWDQTSGLIRLTT